MLIQIDIWYEEQYRTVEHFAENKKCGLPFFSVLVHILGPVAVEADHLPCAVFRRSFC